MKFSHVLGGNTIPDNIKRCLEEQPARSGMYNWIFAHKGEINTFHDIKDRLDDFDQIQVNMSPKDMVFIPELRRRLKGSSTKLIINNDYVCEYWGKWGLDPYKYDQIQRMGDMVFSTEPNQVSNMIDGTFVIPHPSNTKYLKKLGSAHKPTDSMGFIYHWWAPDGKHLGARTINKFIAKHGERYDIKNSTIYGWNQLGDDRMAQHTDIMFDKVSPLQAFPDFAQKIQGERVVYDPNPYHTYGRNGVELACFKRPVVGSNRVLSYNKLFPELTINPMDHNDAVGKFKIALGRDSERICEQAYKDVEQFNYANSLKKWNSATDIAFDRGGVEWNEKQM